ncbi:MAG: S8 family peptidase [Candidatus Aminicenantales bacterium]
MKKDKPLLVILVILLFNFYLSSGLQPKLQKNHPPRPDKREKKIKKGDLPPSPLKGRRSGFHSSRSRYVPGEVLVKFKSYFSPQMAEARIAAYEARKIKKIPRLNIYQIQIPAYTTVMDMVSLLNQNPDVEYAEPNYIGHIAVTPNDAFFNWQYALYNSGQEIWDNGPQGTPRADIRATEAWEETKGVSDIIVAVLDTGVDMTHPDIDENIYSAGRDFVNDDYDATDDHGHGTHVAGIIGAETNNNRGIAGVTWNCRILPVKVADSNGDVVNSALVDGIRWAADNGAGVINLSLGGDVPSQAVEDALLYAYDKNIVIAAAAGNDGGPVLYPAAYDEYCLAVAATDYNDQNPWWSNFGPQIDVAAPGVKVLSLVPTWSTGPEFPYDWKDGTSMSTPHVSGLAALVKGIKPWLENWEIMQIIRFSADDVNSSQYPGKDEYIGYGRINMEKALVPLIITSIKKNFSDK